MRIYCPNCKQKRLEAKYGENQWVKWIDTSCETCGYHKILKEDDLDLIQPSSPLWKMVYDNSPFEEREKKAKEASWAEEKRKEELDRKYDKQFKKPWERKFVKDKVLNGEL